MNNHKLKYVLHEVRLLGLAQKNLNDDFRYKI